MQPTMAAEGVTKMSAPDCKIMSLLACRMTFVPDFKVEVNPEIENPGVGGIAEMVQQPGIHPNGSAGEPREPETDVSTSGTVLIVPVALKKRLVTLALLGLNQ